eukprot:CAMPEP_0201668628 /NCGR_PEP_ID=MMETSP0494-20130426/20291_1 /ASSEMBLY_ACC=CAM_ASM_000839 /TAXON_ID=420259 /ORGANISM="Thalassiosira gravida, Strain GMp14c1" /LENGTH=578 /DNA_ID=CAMNT_0048149093 /DNA_START=132 /DNA_END=1868 /DNA_ORIENTATION=-
MVQQQITSIARAGLLATLLGSASAFTSITPSTSLPSTQFTSFSALSATSQPDVVVISPPGGIGEITSIETARLGGSVKWFVVSAASNTPNMALTAETLAAIEKAGGSMELAGADAGSLLAPPDAEGNTASNDALSAIAGWCGTSGSLICTYDGAFEEKLRVDRMKSPEQIEDTMGVDEEQLIRSGIRVAAREAAARSKSKIVVLAAGEEMPSDDEDGDGDGGKGFFAGLFGGNEIQVPGSMAEAVGGAASVIRHGELFGAAESSPESSPFKGGPKREPIVREMYTTRAVRIDPTISTSGNVLGGDGSTKSNRLSVGEATSRLGLGKVKSATAKMDVSLSSFVGTAPPSDEEWNAEFARVVEMMASSPSSSNARGSAPVLFRTEFSSVPSAERLAEWLAVKWAPAILRSYDIAGTRVGARPVYATQTGEEGTKIEIVWQELVDFQSVTSGKMIIEVDENGMTAMRGGGDAKQGYGGVSNKPLPGEDILVRRLADAASQAVEKGLAVKPKLAKKEVAAMKPVTTVVAEEVAAAPTPPVAAESSGPGPRGAGARRSSERSRGSRKRTTRKPSSQSDADKKA